MNQSELVRTLSQTYNSSTEARLTPPVRLDAQQHPFYIYQAVEAMTAQVARNNGIRNGSTPEAEDLAAHMVLRNAIHRATTEDRF